jgi:hypothetical protein
MEFTGFRIVLMFGVVFEKQREELSAGGQRTRRGAAFVIESDLKA